MSVSRNTNKDDTATGTTNENKLLGTIPGTSASMHLQEDSKLSEVQKNKVLSKQDIINYYSKGKKKLRKQKGGCVKCGRAGKSCQKHQNQQVRYVNDPSLHCNINI